MDKNSGTKRQGHDQRDWDERQEQGDRDSEIEMGTILYKCQLQVYNAYQLEMLHSN